MFKTLGTKAWEFFNTNVGSIAAGAIVTYQVTKSHRAEEIAKLEKTTMSLEKDVQEEIRRRRKLQQLTNELRDKHINQANEISRWRDTALRHELTAREYKRGYDTSFYSSYTPSPLEPADSQLSTSNPHPNISKKN
jgi:membrane-associated HD superfamily phosphohydrolase